VNIIPRVLKFTIFIVAVIVRTLILTFYPCKVIPL